MSGDRHSEGVGRTPDPPSRLKDRYRLVERLGEGSMGVGTVLYLTPETIAGTPADSRADLYAVGAVLYELFTGRIPGFLDRYSANA